MRANSVETKIENKIAYLTFKGEKGLNLFSPMLVQKLEDALRKIDAARNVSAVVIKADGKKAFSAGVNVRRMGEFTPLSAEKFIISLHSLFHTIMTLKKPVIAAVFGPCLGGAMEMIMACDICIASEDASTGLPEIIVGIPSVIEASLLQRVVGLTKARELILTGKSIDAEEAYRLGLFNQVVKRESLEEETRKAAEQFLRLSPHIVGVQKDILYQWMNLGQEQAAAYSIKAFGLCFQSGHPQEAMRAFLEKREPKFIDP